LLLLITSASDLLAHTIRRGFTQGCAFWGLDDEQSHLGVQSPPKPLFCNSVLFHSMQCQVVCPAVSCGFQTYRHASIMFIRLSVCRENAKKRFSQKLSNLELLSIDEFMIVLCAFQITTHYGTPKIQDGGDLPSWILAPKCKNAIFWKLSNLASCSWVFQSIHYWISKIQGG